MIRTSIPRRRSKPRRGVLVNPRYLIFIHTRRCLLSMREDTRCSGMLNAHHVRPSRDPRNDERTVPLCEGHHLQAFGPDAIHRLGQKRWQEKFDVDLEAEILWLQSEFERWKQ